MLQTEISSLQSIKTLLTLELSQYHKSGSIFSSSEPVEASSDCSLLGNTLFVLASKQSRTRTHATELVLDRPGFPETFDLLDFSKWSRR